MTVQEFSNEFDILYNNIMSNTAPGLNDYEKSVLLTKAQEDLIISLYNGTGVNQTSFEETEELRSYLGNLIKTVEITASDDYTGISLNSRSSFFKLPTDLWFITFEVANLVKEDADPERALVVATLQDEFYKILNNPFKSPNKRRVLRLESGSGYIELVCESTYTIDKYIVRYIIKPTPIILCDLDNAKIDGLSEKKECMLHEAMHRKILDRAVLLAKTIYNPN